MLDRLLTTFLLRPRSNPSCNVTCHRQLEYPIPHRPASGELEDSQIVTSLSADSTLVQLTSLIVPWISQKSEDSKYSSNIKLCHLYELPPIYDWSWSPQMFMDIPSLSSRLGKVDRSSWSSLLFVVRSHLHTHILTT